MKYKFEIPGKPQGKERPRLSRTHTYTPKQTKDYENLVKFYFTQKYNIDLQPTTKEMRARIIAIFEPPKSLSTKKRASLIGQGCITKPDADNIAKIILDSLNGLAYKDDNQITELSIQKFYGDEARVIVELE